MNNIGSYIIDSFQEYEGEHSLVLFYVGCNLRCKGCYNYNILSNAEKLYNAKELIDKYITPLHTAIVFLGGEPTIHNIETDMRYAKSKGLKTKLYTNGLEPYMIYGLRGNELLDAISIDFKCIHNCKENIGVSDLLYKNYVELSISESAKKVDGIKSIDVELRTTKFPFLSKSEIIEIEKEVDNMIRFYGNIRHIMQDYVDTENNIK